MIYGRDIVRYRGYIVRYGGDIVRYGGYIVRYGGHIVRYGGYIAAIWRVVRYSGMGRGVRVQITG